MQLCMSMSSLLKLCYVILLIFPSSLYHQHSQKLKNESSPTAESSPEKDS